MRFLFFCCPLPLGAAVPGSPAPPGGAVLLRPHVGGLPTGAAVQLSDLRAVRDAPVSGWAAGGGGVRLEGCSPAALRLPVGRRAVLNRITCNSPLLLPPLLSFERSSASSHHSCFGV